MTPAHLATLALPPLIAALFLGLGLRALWPLSVRRRAATPEVVGRLVLWAVLALLSGFVAAMPLNA